MENNLVATAQTTISPPGEKCGRPGEPRNYQTILVRHHGNSGWKEGSSMTCKGEWKGKSYEDKGRLLQIIPNQTLRYSHFSPISGLEHKPENYHTVTIGLKPVNEKNRGCLAAGPQC